MPEHLTAFTTKLPLVRPVLRTTDRSERGLGSMATRPQTLAKHFWTSEYRPRLTTGGNATKFPMTPRFLEKYTQGAIAQDNGKERDNVKMVMV